MTDLSVIETACTICGKALVGKKCDWVTLKQQKIPFTLVKGYQCRKCGASYCNTEHKKELQFNWWSGYEKSLCPQCNEPLVSGLLLLETSADIADPSALEASPVSADIAKSPTLEASPATTAAMISQQECPKCGGANVSTAKVVKRQTGVKILPLLMGAAFFVGPILLGMPFEDANLNALFKLFSIFMGAWIIWDVLTGLPLPFTGIKLFKVETNTQATCSDCGHQWVV